MTLDISRDRWGRPLIIPPGGGKPVPYQRASGIGKVLEDDTNLAYWRARMSCIGLMKRTDLQALVLAHPDDKDKELRAAVEEAFKAGGGEERRNKGTALHKLSEWDDLSAVPEGLRRDVDAFNQALTDHGIEVLETELFVVHDGWKIAGTMDRLVRHDGAVKVLDIKTGSGVDYGGGSWAMQLRVYAEGVRYDNGVRSPLINNGDFNDDKRVTRKSGLIAHLPAGEGRCTIHEIDLSGAAEAIERALWVKEWRTRSRKLLTPLAPPANGTTATAPAAGGAADDWVQQIEDETQQILDVSRRDHLVRRYQQLRDQGIDAQVIAAVWPTGVPGPKRSSEWGLTDFGLIGTALNRIEAARADGFTEPDPQPVVEREAPAPRPPALSIDEGPDMELDDCEAVRAKVDGLPDDQRHAVAAIVAACAAAGHSISMKQRPSARRFTIARALYFMGLNGDLDQPDEERLRALCAYVTDDDACLMPGVSIGEVVGTLDLGGADRLAALAQRGVAYQIDDVGDIRVAA